MKMYEIIADYQCHTGEGPLWHSDEQALYWVDIPRGRLFRYEPETGQHAMIHEERPIGGYTIQADGTLLCFRDGGNVVVLDSRGEFVRTVVEAMPELATTRFNDVIAAPDGSVFAGTMSCDELAGRLYHLDCDGNSSVILEEQGTPNGMGFSPDLRWMYYQDSRAQKLWRFDYDSASGGVSGQTLLRSAEEWGDRGRGDGLTVDVNGDIWSARWDGGCLIRCDAAGVPQEHYDLPAQCVTSMAFGGVDYRELYVTSAGGDERPDKGAAAGALFRLMPGVAGCPEFRSTIA
jgi:sugar lactone lactonase YvrE